MIEQVLREYLPAILLIMGLMEYAKKYTKVMSKTFYMVLQAVLCLIAGILLVSQTWLDDINGRMMLLIAFKGGLLLSLTTLFYDLLLKKIKEIGKGK